MRCEHTHGTTCWFLPGATKSLKRPLFVENCIEIKECVIWDGKSTVSQVYQCNLSPHLVSGCLGNTMETLAAEEWLKHKQIRIWLVRTLAQSYLLLVRLWLEPGLISDWKEDVINIYFNTEGFMRERRADLKNHGVKTEWKSYCKRCESSWWCWGFAAKWWPSP